MSIRECVLLVEDDLLVQTVIHEVLEEAGYLVVSADTGRGAVEILRRDGAGLCALVTDINLGPPPDGWDVARQARQLNKHLVVVYVSGDSAHQWRARGVPQSLLLEKPFAPDRVTQALAELKHGARA